ncbi:hypothetical protein CONCODRAFT_8051 [Conidiobolus coronatus NRRL 28638]|uniref:Uncharacterized protein n=1 Tax=Conidiobolus coronatus (strain ATCC 28846 / CBS 209.66 / NRRL 28638) TaxID=796925 RepID=A0A137P3D9_CONC2|nr:hypothetical protein CONCODRAFT_8051 [Conidiobolus coronatus NRRL 28638]|eukprot:KXN69540.1 hypothetical protein CONCODRAFT_8051 [Conidiobolus coronatus NRRL 28638]
MSENNKNNNSSSSSKSSTHSSPLRENYNDTSRRKRIMWRRNHKLQENLETLRDRETRANKYSFIIIIINM